MDETQEHTAEEFYKLAEEKFGEKFSYNGIRISEVSLKKFNAEYNSTLTKEDFENYKEIWLLENKCPNCGSDLGGIFGAFIWGIVHGEGSCSECNKVYFRLYHYVNREKCPEPIQAFSLIGF